MSIENILKILEKENIQLEWLNLNHFLGIYVRIDNQDVIVINSKLKTLKEIKLSLIHELGHFFTGTIYFCDMDRYYIAKCEYKALKWASMFLMPKDKIVEAINKGITEVWELAEYFEVSEELVRFRLGLPDLQDIKEVF